MKRSLFGVLAASLALAFAGCGGGRPTADGGNQGGGGTRTSANRFAVVVLVPGTQGRTCDVLASDDVAFRADHFEWRVYNFCPGATPQPGGQPVHFTLQFNSASPAQPGTERFDAVIDATPPGYARLSMTVDKNPTGGNSCNGVGLCFKYSFYLANNKVLDPDFEVDP